MRGVWGDDLVGKQEYPGSDPEYPGITVHVYNPGIGGWKWKCQGLTG